MRSIKLSHVSRTLRLSLLGAAVGAAALLTGCVIAPLGPPIGVYRSGPVYVDPAPVVIVPGTPRGYYVPGHRGYPYGGYYGNRGYRGYRGDHDGR